MRVLITGGSGSFGRAMTQRLLDAKHEVICYSRGEHAQAELEIYFRLHGYRYRRFIGDVRDRDRLRRAFAGVDIVLHAAALKRIEVGYYNPIEMVKTNVDGAINVVEAALDAGVPRTVMLSTDKAYQPISAYGHSKALAEQIFLGAYRNNQQPRFAVTRYGNVWKSAGSVVPKWQDLMKQGVRKLPVTDPDATRFFMTMDEACDLVWKAATMLKPPAEPIIPELPAYRLGQIIKAMGAEMEVIGMGDWEKKHEGMRDGLTSDIAPRLTIEQIQGALHDRPI
jgi:UDP-N-acetylglucosamine 4,6-dehydratase